MTLEVLDSTVDQIVSDYGVMIKSVPMSEMFINPRFQRNLNSKRAETIAGTFDPLKFGVLLVNRVNGRGYSITDGQHRFEAAKLLGFTELCCQVIAVSEEREAVLFVEIQHLRKDVKGYERHRAMATAKIDQALEIDRVLRSEGFKIGPTVHTPTAITAARAVHLAAFGEQSVVFPSGPGRSGFGEFYVAGRVEALRKSLRSIRHAWGTDGSPKSRSSVVIGALAFIFDECGEHIDDDRMFDVLHSEEADWWLNRSAGRKKTDEKGSAEVLLARHILEAYIKKSGGYRSSAGKKLDWHKIPRLSRGTS